LPAEVYENNLLPTLDGRAVKNLCVTVGRGFFVEVLF
jgi:hypothetical protein